METTMTIAIVTAQGHDNASGKTCSRASTRQTHDLDTTVLNSHAAPYRAQRPKTHGPMRNLDVGMTDTRPDVRLAGEVRTRIP